MNPADLRDQLHASLATVTAAPSSVEDVRRAGLRRRRTREGLAGLAVAALAVGVVALVGGSGPDRDALRPGGPSPTPYVTPTAPTVPEAGAWEAWKAEHPGTASNAFHNRNGAWGASSKDGVVTVAVYDGTRFEARASVRLDQQQSVTSLVVAEITADSDSVPDVVATGPAGNAVLTSVLVATGDTWQVAPFAPCGGTAATCTALPSAELVGRAVVAQLSSCVPNCVEASRRHVAYTWSGPEGAFVAPASPGLCAADSTAWYWKVVAVHQSGSTVEVTYQVADIRCDAPAPHLEGTGEARHEIVPADLPVGGETAATMQPGTYEVQHQDRTVTRLTAVSSE